MQIKENRGKTYFIQFGKRLTMGRDGVKHLSLEGGIINALGRGKT